MNTLKERRELLQERITEVEETLARLKLELKEVSEREQHQAIDRLDEYLGDLDNKHANLQAFGKVLKQEIRTLFGGDSTKTGA